jgi:phosphonate transport system substrate-binding protein
VRPFWDRSSTSGRVRSTGSFQSALITRDDAPFQSAADLVGGRLALPSELSFSANWLRLDPEIQKILPLEKLEVVQYFPHHQTVVFEVLQGNFDAGVVKDRVAHEFRHRGLRILAISQPVPGSPLVVPALENPALEAAILDALLALDPTDPATATRLSTWDPEFAFGFTRARDEDYNRIRALLTRGDR